MNELPKAWVLDLTKDELDLYNNLVPDYLSGTVKSEFMLRREINISALELNELVELFRDPEIDFFNEFWFYEDAGATILVLTGSTPLINEDEKEIYDSLMAKIRARHRAVMVERIEDCHKMIAKLEKELDEYVW